MPLHRLTPLSGAALAALSLATSQSVWAQAQEAGAPAPAASSPARPADGRPGRPEGDRRTERLERVEVSGGASDSTQRRAATAAKIIVGREEIERFGDGSVSELLKRLPGVTMGGRPGRGGGGGGPRMRGMGSGYTQLLVNGERVPPGFSLDDLPPDQVERIEVMRAPTAEYGARAVAGTINIVLREALVKRNNELRLGLSREQGRSGQDISWTRNGALDEQGGAYSLSLSAGRQTRDDDVDKRSLTEDLRLATVSPLLQSGRSSNERERLHLNARLQWRLGAGSSLTLMPMLMAGLGDSRSRYRQQPARDYAQVQSEGDSRFRMLRLNAQWQQRLDADSRLELRGGLGRSRMDSDSERQQWQEQGLLLIAGERQSDVSDNRDRSWSLAAKLSRQLPSEHSLVGGLEAEGVDRQQQRFSRVNGQLRAELNEFGDDLQAGTLRLAAWLQDEWQPSAQWSAYAGLRWEGIRTESEAANYALSNRSSVWTPLLHAVWKPDPKSRDQLRISLTRSYRPPNVQNLIARPTINSQYELDTETGSYPDRAGNPALKPEMATGIDLAWERYLSKGGVLSVSLFARRITDLIRNLTERETVSWSDAPRWVSRPRNIGTALSSGIELEAKFRLDELFADALPVSLRANLSLFDSSVTGIPGPNNRIDSQPRGSANLGADYRLSSLPLSLGGNITLTPSSTIQQSLSQRSYSSHKRVADAFVLWNFNRDTALRVSASNLLPLDYRVVNVMSTERFITTSEDAGRSFTQWSLRLELKL